MGITSQVNDRRLRTNNHRQQSIHILTLLVHIYVTSACEYIICYRRTHELFYDYLIPITNLAITLIFTLNRLLVVRSGGKLDDITVVVSVICDEEKAVE